MQSEFTMLELGSIFGKSPATVKNLIISTGIVPYTKPGKGKTYYINYTMIVTAINRSRGGLDVNKWNYHVQTENYREVYKQGMINKINRIFETLVERCNKFSTGIVETVKPYAYYGLAQLAYMFKIDNPNRLLECLIMFYDLERVNTWNNYVPKSVVREILTNLLVNTKYIIGLHNALSEIIYPLFTSDDIRYLSDVGCLGPEYKAVKLDPIRSTAAPVEVPVPIVTRGIKEPELAHITQNISLTNSYPHSFVDENGNMVYF